MKSFPESVKDLSGNEIKLTKTLKRQILWEIFQNKKLLFDEVYQSMSCRYGFIVDFWQPGVYRYQSDKFELIQEGRELYLVRKNQPWNCKKVYEDGVFNVSLYTWLMESNEIAGKGYPKGYPAFSLMFSNQRVIIRDHQLVAMLAFGEQALLAVGKDHVLVINHLDGDRWNSSRYNLELTTKKGNREHYLHQLRK